LCGVIYFTFLLSCRPTQRKSKRYAPVAPSIATRKKSVTPCSPNITSFDPHDLVQLKYETIRAVEVDDRPIAQASVDFGLSRPTIYEAQENFRDEGLGGLLPQKRGPKKARKLTPEVRRYLEELVGSEPDLKAPVLVKRVRRRFGIVLHPRTIEKALVKKGRQKP